MKKKDEERILRIVQLRDVNLEVCDLLNSNNTDDNDSDDGILNTSQERIGATLIEQAYDYIRSQKNNGVSATELAAYFGQNKLACRTLIRNLERSKSISSYSCNEGRQKLHRFAARIIIRLIILFHS